MREAKRLARAQGCVCGVEAKVGQSDHPLAAAANVGVTPVSLRHDDWCPLLRTMQERSPDPLARTQLVIYRPGGAA